MYFITLFLCTYFLPRPPSLRPQRRACAIDTSPAERRADNRHEESSRLQTQSSRTTTTTARQCKISCKSFFSHQIAQQQIFSHTPPPFFPKNISLFHKMKILYHKINFSTYSRMNSKSWKTIYNRLSRSTPTYRQHIDLQTGHNEYKQSAFVSACSFITPSPSHWTRQWHRPFCVGLLSLH